MNDKRKNERHSERDKEMAELGLRQNKGHFKWISYGQGTT